MIFFFFSLGVLPILYVIFYFWGNTDGDLLDLSLFPFPVLGVTVCESVRAFLLYEVNYHANRVHSLAVSNI
jgi:hypothetical protein